MAPEPFGPFFCPVSSTCLYRASHQYQVALFLCRDAGDTQPRHFTDVGDFVEFVRAHPKKGVQMSQYSVDELYLLWRDYMEHDMPTGDPVDSYVTRYAHRLGFRRDGSDGKSFIQGGGSKTKFKIFRI